LVYFLPLPLLLPLQMPPQLKMVLLARSLAKKLNLAVKPIIVKKILM